MWWEKLDSGERVAWCRNGHDHVVGQKGPMDVVYDDESKRSKVQELDEVTQWIPFFLWEQKPFNKGFTTAELKVKF